MAEFDSNKLPNSRGKLEEITADQVGLKRANFLTEKLEISQWLSDIDDILKL